MCARPDLLRATLLSNGWPTCMRRSAYTTIIFLCISRRALQMNTLKLLPSRIVSRMYGAVNHLPL
jgi:hypothetical protein